MAEEESTLPEGSQHQATPPLDIEVEATPGGEDEVGQEVDDPKTKKRAARKEGPVLREREPGKSILPFSRVQKIIKADKDLPMVAKDATFLISLATEEFIKRLSEACQRVAEREKRTTVQQKDVASIVRRADEFLFLDEIISFQRTEPPAKRQPKVRQAEQSGLKPTTLLDKFIQGPQTSDQDGTPTTSETPAEVVMDEDGAMYAG